LGKKSDRLIILTHRPDESSGEDILSNCGDILALSLPAIQYLDAKQIAYFSLGDFIKQKEHDVYLSVFSEAFSEFLENCDHQSEKLMSTKKLFSSNGFGFLHLCLHLSMSQILMDKLEKQYDHIDLYTLIQSSSYERQKIDFFSLQIYINSLTGLDGLVECLILGMKIKKIHRMDADQNFQQCAFLNQPLNQLVKRSPEVVTRRFREFIKNLIHSIQAKKGIFWVTDKDYNIKNIEMLCAEWHFKPFLKKEMLIANKSRSIDTSLLEERIIGFSKIFFGRWLPRFSSILLDIIRDYIQNVVAKIPQVRLSIDKRIKEEKPHSVLFSAGIANVLHATVADVASENDIPVYAFKHSGIELSFLAYSQYLDTYRDYHLDIKRTQFLHNEVELDIFKDSDAVNAVVLGNLKPRARRARRNEKNILKSNKIIYGVGPTDHASFHGYHWNLNDSDRHLWTKDLLDSIAKNNLPIDIKLHPKEWQIYQTYFQHLLKEEQYKKIQAKLIVGGTIQRLFSSYDLLIIDIIGTQILSSALSMGMEIILFRQQEHSLNQLTFPDLENRVHVVSDYGELDKLLRAFSQGTLADKNSQAFEKKYLQYNPDIINILTKNMD